MEIVNSVVKFLIPLTLIYISITNEEQSAAQITGLVGLAIFVLSFLSTPPIGQLIIVGLISLLCLFMGESIIIFLHRTFRK